MIAEFGAWYRAVQLEPNDERLKKRWVGIDKYAKACTVDGALELARIFNGLPARSESWFSKFTKGFQEEDAAFNADSASAELTVLAGTTIAQLIVSKSLVADLAASAAQVVEFGVDSARRRIPEIRNRLKSHLVERAMVVRGPTARKLPRKDRTEKIDAIHSALQTGSQAADPLKILLTELSTDMAETERRLFEAEQVRQESSEILWWLVSQYCDTLQQPYSSVAPKVQPVISAFELATLTRMTPGLPNARAFLTQMVGTPQSPPSPPTEWIRAIGRETRTRIVQEAQRGKHVPTLPVLDSMRKSLELASDDVWLADANLSSPALAAPVSPIDFGEQIYREIMLCKNSKMSE